MRWMSPLVLSLLAGALLALAAPARAGTDDGGNGRFHADNYLILHRSRGTLAPGTGPSCFEADRDPVVQSYYTDCPAHGPVRPGRGSGHLVPRLLGIDR